MILFCLGDVETDIAYLYEVLPQLSRIFRIIDKIGEGLPLHFLLVILNDGIALNAHKSYFFFFLLID